MEEGRSPSLGWQGSSPDQFAARHGVKHDLSAISEASLGIEITPPYGDLGEASLKAFPHLSTKITQAGRRQSITYTVWDGGGGSLMQVAHSFPALLPSPICRANDAPAQQHWEQHDAVMDSPRETQRHHSGL